jgi:hypothetical protein
LIFESPLKAQQTYMVRKFGSEVNLGNIAATEVIGLETLRLGLRADTMAAFPLAPGFHAARAEARAEGRPLVAARAVGQGSHQNQAQVVAPACVQRSLE